MAKSETVRVRDTTARALRTLAYSKRWNCSIAEFLAIVERGDNDAWSEWTELAKRLKEMTE